MSDGARFAAPPATTLSLTSLCQIACSEAECAKHYPATPFGRSCAAILLCDLRPSAAHCGRFPPGLRLDWTGPAPVDSQSLF